MFLHLIVGCFYKFDAVKAKIEKIVSVASPPTLWIRKFLTKTARADYPERWREDSKSFQFLGTALSLPPEIYVLGPVDIF